MGIVEQVSTEHRLIVHISDMRVSDSPRDVIVTYSLGSCVGLSLYDPVARVGGIVHCMLPLSKIDKRKAAEKPCMFTDKGVPALLKAVFDLGATSRYIIAKVAGAASLLDERGLFKVGERNFTVLRKVLWKNNIILKNRDIGGSAPRTMILEMATGRTFIKIAGVETEL